mmetsp:Transcript_74587/g.242216  ORF Transcript_74587/g.242216 Transcript_74587/m.242216 type:complete len:221 (+) Transcript_74587:1357-2019(+)
MRKPSSARWWSTCSRTQPASQVMMPVYSSTSRTLFILFVEMTTSSNTGTEPPTRPVLPPCGQTAIFRLWQCAMIFESCSVVLGRSTTLARPRTVPSQSTLNASRPPPSASSARSTSAAGSTLLKNSMSAVVTSAKSPRLIGYRSEVKGGKVELEARRPLGAEDPGSSLRAATESAGAAPLLAMPRATRLGTTLRRTTDAMFLGGGGGGGDELGGPTRIWS